MPSPFPGMNPYLEQPAVWNDDARPHFLGRAIFCFDSYANRPFAFEQDVHDAHAFVSFDAVLARVVQHHVVEFAANDLPGL